MSSDDYEVSEELRTGLGEGRGLYALVRFRSGVFGITRDGTPLVHIGTLEEAQRYFALLVPVNRFSMRER